MHTPSAPTAHLVLQNVTLRGSESKHGLPPQAVLPLLAAGISKKAQHSNGAVHQHQSGLARYLCFVKTTAFHFTGVAGEEMELWNLPGAASGRLMGISWVMLLLMPFEVRHRKGFCGVP